MEENNVEALRALIMQVIKDVTVIEQAPAPVKTQTRTYIKTDVRAKNLLQELVECDVAYKEALNTRKQAEAVAAASRARIEELLVESRKLKITQAQVGEALGISGGSVSSRMVHARKAVRNRKKTK
jgi:DNA-directed RNA polymerase specialized sigma24 family protein